MPNQNPEYEDLIASIEARPDKINLLLAVCSDNTTRDRLIADYEAELDSDIRCYHIKLPRNEPSMRLAITTKLVEKEAHLQRGGKAVVTVTGADELRDYRRDDEERSEREVFFGICSGRGKP
jgi:hypothetical protein